MYNSKNNEKLTFFLYARKSEENEERQVQSIPDQIDRLKTLASSINLEIKEVFIEAKSAKKPFNRPVFAEMLKRIEKGEANSILCWQSNRLFRNPVDYGTVSWMLQEGVIKCIQTIDRQFLPTDNVLMLGVEASMANQFIVDLRKGVARGIESKLNKGWAPIVAPVGYRNTKNEAKGENYIAKDPERFALIRKAWDLMLTGTITPPQILDKLNNEWGFRTRKTRVFGDKPLCRAGIYRVFTNQFYTGIFEFKGKMYNGKHEPMVTLEEFDRIQILLGRKGKPRRKEHEFPYTGMISCKECGSTITAIKKDKLVKSTGRIESYVYYYCTRNKVHGKCSQRKYTQALALEAQIRKELEKYKINKVAIDWARKTLEKFEAETTRERVSIDETRKETIHKLELQLENLTRMRYKDLISDNEFISERTKLQSEKVRLECSLNNQSGYASRWIELSEEVLDYVEQAPTAFEVGSSFAKKAVLNGLCENCELGDQKLFISPREWLIPVAKAKTSMNEEIETLELEKDIDTSRENDNIDSLRLIVRALVDDLRTVFTNKHDTATVIPSLAEFTNRPP